MDEQPHDEVTPTADAKAAQVRSMFDRIAPRYTLVNTLVSFGRDAYWRRQAVRMAEVRPADRLLDVCCGPGDLADVFTAADPAPARIVASDFSSEMMHQAELRQAKRQRPLELVQADALHLPFAAGSFDLVSCAFGVRNLADVRAGLAEFARVLAPGGRLVVLEFSAASGFLRRCYEFYFKHVLPRVGGSISGDREAYRYLPRSVASFFSPRELADILREVGLTDVRQRAMTLGVAVVTVAKKP